MLDGWRGNSGYGDRNRGEEGLDRVRNTAKIKVRARLWNVRVMVRMGVGSGWVKRWKGVQGCCKVRVDGEGHGGHLWFGDCKLHEGGDGLCVH